MHFSPQSGYSVAHEFEIFWLKSKPVNCIKVLDTLVKGAHNRIKKARRVGENATYLQALKLRIVLDRDPLFMRFIYRGR